MESRKRLLDLHKEHNGTPEEFSKEKTDVELMIDLIESLFHAIEHAKDHSHMVS